MNLFKTSKLELFRKYFPWVAGVALVVLASFLYVDFKHRFGEDQLGYSPVTGYQSRTTSYISSSAATIPVASTQDNAGNQITLSNISSTSTVKVYMNLEPGTSREEAIYCTGVTSNSWTGCVRGLAFQGSSESSSSTLSKAHNAGASIIITNIAQFYNQYISVDGNQEVYDIKTFHSYPKFHATSTLPTLDSEFATKLYVDGVGAGGFTAANVSTTRGLSVDGSSPERVGINASSTAGLAFDSSGKVYVNTSSTGGLTFDDAGRLKVDGTQNFNFSGNTTFSGNVTSTGSFVIANASTSTGSISSIGYVNSLVFQGVATGTAGIAISAGNALYISSTSTLFKTSSSAASSTFQFVGIALSDAASGQEVSYTKPGGINCALSSLSPGFQQYLNGTAGQISATPGTFTARIGLALNANCALVMPPKFMRTGTATFAAGVTTPLFVETGFYPAHLTLMMTTQGQGGAVSGISISDESGGVYFPGSLTTGDVYSVSANSWFTKNSEPSTHDGGSSKSATGFTLTPSTNARGTTIFWTAESL